MSSESHVLAAILAKMPNTAVHPNESPSHELGDDAAPTRAATAEAVKVRLKGRLI
jgi:hypothetical protein